MKFLARLSATLGLIVTGSILFATAAHAATFTVTSTGDDSAVAPAVGCATVLPDCTLRSAIEAANAQAGADTIEFNIAGGGVHTFTPASDYEQIIEQVTIDGSTQTGSSCGTLVPTELPGTNNPHTLLIEIDGSGSGTGGGLDLGFGSDSSIIRGLVLNNSQSRPEIQINANTVTLECNYIGTTDDGSAAGANNTSSGISASGDDIIIQNNLISGNISIGATLNGNGAESSFSNNLVGTTANGLSALPNTGIGVELSGLANLVHNIISGNGGDGVSITNNSNSVHSNFIGLSVNGSPLGNGSNGVITSRNTNNYTIGGVGLGNIISANEGNGIVIASSSGDSCPSNILSQILGNKIGTKVNGEIQAGYGNSGSGISANETVGSNCVSSVYKHQVGGDNSGEPNTIAGNTLDGVRVYEYINPGDAGDHTDVFSVSVLQNNIFGNGNLGINLATASDPFDGIANVDIGPNALNSFLIDYPASHANNYLNHPLINSLSTSGNNVTINYSFQAPPGVTENLPALQASNLVGYRLDFYLNTGTQDGAYSGYSQGKTHLGSFIVDSSEAGATHTFTSPIALSGNQNITATATILWSVETCPGQNGSGPPYGSCE